MNIERDSFKFDEGFARALEACELGKLSDAEKILDATTCSSRGEEAEVYFLRAGIEIRRGNTEEAYRMLLSLGAAFSDQLTLEDELFWQVEFRLAALEVNAQKIHSALPRLRRLQGRAFADDLTRKEFSFWLGRCLENLNQLAEAEHLLKDAAQSDDLLIKAQATFFLGRVYYRQGRFAWAFQMFEKCSHEFLEKLDPIAVSEHLNSAKGHLSRVDNT